MKRAVLKLMVSLSFLAVAACSAEEGNEATTTEVASSEAPDASISVQSGPDGGSLLSERPEIPVTLPRMAYAFDYGFRLPGKDVATLEQKHADMCEALGPYNCQIVSLTTTGERDEDIRGELRLAVAASRARSFASQLSAAAKDAGADAFKANITGEDLSKTIVDTEARIHSRIALRDRLLEVLKTRKGTVQELVDAERGVAQVNEEIDQAQSWLKEQRGRVTFSTMTLSYESARPGGSFFAPIKGAVGALGSILGVVVALLILLGAVGLPILAGVMGIRRLRRRFGWEPNEA